MSVPTNESHEEGLTGPEVLPTEELKKRVGEEPVSEFNPQPDPPGRQHI